MEVSYHPHSLMMETPFMLLKGRKPCTIALPGWMGRAGKGKIDEEKLSERVKKEQKKYDGNVRSEVKRDRFMEGDWVRTRLYDGSRKGLSKWSLPKKVIDVRRYSVILENGKRWSTEDVVKCTTRELHKCDDGVDGSDESTDENVQVEKRLTRKPSYLKEYYID
ncbi:hypothetical protein NDU88_001873 [Pleurodeles waltl]|uniref:Uncharacterized protein n=1 Tax=Pleurodeles waltl TaxID=8319 RepID=A0AAV7PCG0_PLEWA|nr:hypothetical protein NDU88_001873 [Pleurodeles waltl]